MRRATGVTRSETIALGAWRCDVLRADGSVRSGVLYSMQYDDHAERRARGWYAWITGALDGVSRLEHGETVRLQFRAPGAARFAAVSP